MSAGQLYPDCQTSDTGDKIIKLAGAVLRRYEVPGHTVATRRLWCGLVMTDRVADDSKLSK